MHTLIITPKLLHSALLRSALNRQNIKSLLCTPNSLSQDWCPSTDAILLPHPFTPEEWRLALPFLQNLSRKLPFVFLKKIDELLLKDPQFKNIARQSISIDESIPIDEIPLLIKDVIQKNNGMEPQKQVHLGLYTLDRSQRLLRQGGEEKLLTKKEFFLLELFIQYQGQILSRERIIDQLWDKNSYVDPNSVDVTVSRLRKKLALKRTDALLRTIPCLGYQLCLDKSTV